jgi:hypothetical protein
MSFEEKGRKCRFDRTIKEKKLDLEKEKEKHQQK